MTDEQAVYSQYRRVLAAQTGGHAAQRRQAARKATVERYNIPYAEVKAIVAEFDAANGVTHEHTEQYKRELELLLARQEFTTNPVPCGCGSTEDVSIRVMPYEWEIEGIFKFKPCCLNCWTLNYLDI